MLNSSFKKATGNKYNIYSAETLADSLTVFYHTDNDSVFLQYSYLKLPAPATVPPMELTRYPKTPKKPSKLPKPGSPPPCTEN